MRSKASSARSLARRLSAFFAGVSFLLLAAIGVFLHHALAQQFHTRDATELHGKIELIRHTLNDVNSAQAIRDNPQRWLDVIVGHHGLHLGIYGENGVKLLESSNAQIPPIALLTPAPAFESSPPVREWIGSNGAAFRAVSAWATLGRSNNERVLIAFALDLTEERKMLAEYRTSIIAAIAVGTLLAAALGTWAAKQGLAPLESVAAAASRITASRLDERLDVGSAPLELQTLTGAYNAMLGRLQESFVRLSQFSSDLAHDLRTPIGNLLGEAQVALSRTRDADDYRSVIESSVEELERLSRMLESMLFLARADNAQLALHPEYVDLDIEFGKIRDYFEPLAQEKEVSLEVSGGARVHADPVLLRRAISNLVANAIRFSPSAGGEVTLTAHNTSDGGAQILVSNVGPEIAAQERERIFDRFYRIGRARADSNVSSGLGLAIVRSIMALHAGSASVECSGGRTFFTLSFPPLRTADQSAPSGVT